MNFKPLENEKQYEYTKYWIKIFKEQIESLKKQHKKTSNFIGLAEHIYYTKHIMEAEVQDYEHRKRGDY
ncbi:hypothetical protein ES703_96944 [subsurface metagenome]